MSLFFYGAVELRDDASEVTSNLAILSIGLSWSLRLNELQEQYPTHELFCLPEGFQKNLLVFELIGRDDGVYTELYDDYGGDILTQYYRKIAKDIGISNYQEIEFGSLAEVDKAYRERPFNLPVIRFVQELSECFSGRDILVCLDEGFENRFGCKALNVGKEGLLREVWMTIAYGYSWPNIRLWYTPGLISKHSPKAHQYSKIRTVVDLKAEFSDRFIPKGTLGVIVECYDEPEGYAVDLTIPDSHLVGGFSYENIILYPDQFDVVENALVLPS